MKKLAIILTATLAMNIGATAFAADNTDINTRINDLEIQIQHLKDRQAKQDKQIQDAKKAQAAKTNINFQGQVDIRYSDQNNGFANGTIFAPNKAAGQYRLRLGATADLGDNITAGMRFKTAPSIGGNVYKYDASTFVTFGSGQDADKNSNQGTLYMDRLYVAGNLGRVRTTVGAQAWQQGIDNVIIDSGAYNFDGVSFAGKAGDLNMIGQWGRVEGASNVGTSSNLDLASGEAYQTSGDWTYGAGYAQLKDDAVPGSVDGGVADTQAGQTLARYTYGYARYAFAPNFSVGGQYLNNGAYSTDNKAYYLYALYGTQALAKAGDSNIKVYYYKSGANGLSRFSGLDMTNTYNSNAEAIGNSSQLDNFYAGSVVYTYQVNPKLQAYAQFTNIFDTGKTADSGKDLGYKYYRLGLTAKF
jgi:hypothetical protein